ncbi:MAG: heme-copper oxidase subunit III [Candidatus Omnitrophica bacterium]|nr:heme-copper oxidase subunit III [Candidatus Omnitrophota bacterium]MCA9402606.1 heme-copper oxidase subunit III [Candidatus Omnitrophota bacterium]MCB9721048.1 heme-copper oxidase subunit III [Candidatus Omnitrophota bacterium]
MSQSLSVRKDVWGDATTGKLGMWLFILIDGLSFGTLLIGGAALRAGAASWPEPGTVLNIPLTAFNTFLLICTSFTMVMALNSVQRDDQKGLVKFLLLTMLGGMIFLGIQVYEYTHFIMGSEHLGEQLAKAGMSGTKFLTTSSVYAGAFYVTTCYHGLHVFSGVIYIFCILMAAMRGRYSSQDYDKVEILGLYWHFVDLIWILVFTVIYLI